MNRFERVTLTVICRRCGADRGERCTTRSGTTTQTHAVRFDDIRPAWNLGYEEGLEEAVQYIDRPHIIRRLHRAAVARRW